MSRGVIKVAKKGFDIRYAHPRNLTVDSTKNQFKIHMEGSGTLVIPESVSAVFRVVEPVFHGLDYQPQVLVEFENPKTGGWALGPCLVESPNEDSVGYCTDSRGPGEYIIIVYNRIDIFDPGHDEYSVNYRYKIFTEPIKDVWT